MPNVKITRASVHVPGIGLVKRDEVVVVPIDVALKLVSDGHGKAMRDRKIKHKWPKVHTRQA